MKVDCACCGDDFELVINVFALYENDTDNMLIFDIIQDEHENRKKRKQVNQIVRDKIPLRGDVILMLEVHPNLNKPWKIAFQALALDEEESFSKKIMEEKYIPKMKRHVNNICDDILSYMESKCSEEETTH